MPRREDPRIPNGRPLPGLAAAGLLLVLPALLWGAAAAGCRGGSRAPDAAGGETAPASGPELIIVGLDAADERLIADGIAAGRLPNLARIAREGTRGPLRTHRPFLSPILWTTMATGLTPDRHGVLDFVEEDEQGRTVPVSARSMRAPPFWSILGDRGVRCAVVGWLATWPASPVNGLLVSDRFTIHPYGEETADPRRGDPAGKTWPASLYDTLADTIVPPAAITDADLRSVFGAPEVPAGADVQERRELRVIEATTRTYAGAALRLQRLEKPRLLAVYFEGIDRLMHLFGALMPPALPGADRGRAARYGAAVERFYTAMDAQVGRFMQAAGDRGTLLVISDHGFKLGAERPRHPALRTDVFAAEWHRDPGILMAWGRGVRRGARIDEADIYDIAPTVLAYFGAPASATMRGRALTELFEPGFLPPSPPRVPSYEPRERPAAAAAAAGEDRELLENLKALGYVGGGQSAAARVSANLATYYLEEKQYEKAIELYRQVLAKDPADLIALYNLGFAYKLLGSPAKAAECFERILRERPDYTEARLVLSDCYVSLGRADRAIEVLGAAGKDARSDPAWLNHLGTVLASAGRLEEAETALRRAIELRPDEASAYLNLARVERASGDRAGAIETLRRAAAAAPGDPRVSARLKELDGETR